MNKYLIIFVIIVSNSVFGQSAEGQILLGESALDRFGSTLSFGENGRFMAVGARFQKIDGIEVGAVTVYENISDTWVQYGDVIYGEGGMINLVIH